MTSRLERLDERYRFHHADRKEFVFGADERAGLISELVGGKGKAVLDLGCRTGALTQHYADGNWVVGVDVDRRALDLAQERLGIETVWADVEDELPFADASFESSSRARCSSISPTRRRRSPTRGACCVPAASSSARSRTRSA
jgi:SAM-dependent methyltransferase